MPAAKARTTICKALVVNGSAKKTPARAASESTRIQRRDARSMRRPATKPMATMGRNSTMRSALTQFASSVRSHTSTTSATNASQVPTLEASVARKSKRKPGASCSNPSRAPLRPHVTVGTVAPAPYRAEPSKGGLCAFEHPPERSGEQVVLLPRPDGDANRPGRSEGGERADDDAFPEKRLEDGLRVVAHLGEDEVRDRGCRDREADARACLLELCPSRGRQAAAAHDLLLVSETGEGGVLRGLVDVEGVANLADRLDDVRRADPVADSKTGEPVDLRERPQDEDAAPALEVLLDTVGVVGLLDVLEVRLVEDGEHVCRYAPEIRLDLGARDHRPGRVVRVAQVDDLCPRADLAEDALDVVAVVGERDALRLG